MPRHDASARDVAETYYDSDDADAFYREVWGGEDIHIGLYRPGDSIAQASRRTVDAMADRLAGLAPGARVLDLGSGYGGAARRLAERHGVDVTCLNLSDVENARNRDLTAKAGLQDRVRVLHGAFEDISEPDESFDIVWSQDAFLHSADRSRCMAEAARVLAPGGEMIFTDPMQDDGLEDPAVLRPIYDRIHLDGLASVAFYRRELAALGLEEVGVDLMTDQLVRHYDRVRQALVERRVGLEAVISPAYLDRMIDGLGHWVEAGRQGQLEWGVLHFRKPA